MKKQIFIISLLTFFSTTSFADGDGIDTFEKASKKIGAKNIGVCAVVDKSDGGEPYRINSFKHINNLLSKACHAHGLLTTEIQALQRLRLTEPTMEGKLQTDSIAVNKCMKLVNAEQATNWKDVREDFVNTNNGELNFSLKDDFVIKADYIFSPAYFKLQKKLKELKAENNDPDTGIIKLFSTKCEAAPDQNRAIEVNQEWQVLCDKAYGSSPETLTKDELKKLPDDGEPEPEPELAALHTLFGNPSGTPPSPQISDFMTSPEEAAANSTISMAIRDTYQATSNEIKDCVAIMLITNGRYKSNEKNYITQPNVSTFDNSITCVDAGAEALDYDKCTEFVGFYNYTEILRVGEQTASQMITQNATFEAQMNSDPNDPANVMRQQLRVIEGQKTAADVATAALGLRASLLTGYGLYEFFTREEVMTECSEKMNQGYVGQNPTHAPYLKIGDSTTINGSEKFKDTYPQNPHNVTNCQKALMNVTLYTNVDNQRKAKGMAVAALAETGAKVAEGQMARNNMELLEKAINDVDEATEATETPDFFTDLKVGPCAENPESDECRSAGFNTGLSMVNPTINTGTTVRGTTDGVLNADEEATDSTAVTGTESPDDIADSISSSTSTDRSGSGGVSGPRAAKIVSGGSISQGGGGGGGGGSASTGPAQGGGGGAAAPSTSAVGNNRKMKFNDNDSSRLSFSGGQGVGSGSSKRRSKGNPLAALMGKNKGGSKTQKYARGTASLGRKSGNIFDQISTRYKDVNGKKRLIKYEQR